MRSYDIPPHVARPPHQFGTVVGPVVRFRGQPVDVGRSTPRDTTDPRYLACTDHHLACDCREAEQNEQINEFRAEFNMLRRAIVDAIDGHATTVYVDHSRRPDLECKCAVCTIARNAGLGNFTDATRVYTANGNVPF